MLFGWLLKVKISASDEDLQNLILLHVINILFLQKKQIRAVVIEIAFYHKTVFLVTYGFFEIRELR